MILHRPTCTNLPYARRFCRRRSSGIGSACLSREITPPLVAAMQAAATGSPCSTARTLGMSRYQMRLRGEGPRRFLSGLVGASSSVPNQTDHSVSRLARLWWGTFLALVSSFVPSRTTRSALEPRWRSTAPTLQVQETNRTERACPTARAIMNFIQVNPCARCGASTRCPRIERGG